AANELVDQLDILPEFVAACGFANAKAPGYEADDFLAAAVSKEERRGTVVVATGDRDAYQLASAKTTILQPIKAGEMARIGPAEVRERYGVESGQVNRCRPSRQIWLPRQPARRWSIRWPGRRTASLSFDSDHGSICS